MKEVEDTSKKSFAHFIFELNELNRKREHLKQLYKISNNKRTEFIEGLIDNENYYGISILFEYKYFVISKKIYNLLNLSKVKYIDDSTKYLTYVDDEDDDSEYKFVNVISRFESGFDYFEIDLI